MALTANYAWPTPELSDPANVPADLKALADAVDATSKSIASTGVPIGALAMWMKDTIPAGVPWLLCQGQANIPAVDYPVLASVLGVVGSFVKMPDLRARFPLGSGTGHPIGETPGGAETVTLSQAQLPAHTHGLGTLSVPAHGHADTFAVAAAGSHVHPLSNDGRYVAGISMNATWHQSYARGWDGGVKLPFVFYDDGATLLNIGQTGDGGSHGHTLNGGVTNASALTPTGALANTGGGGAVPNMPPYFVVNFIVKADH